MRPGLREGAGTVVLPADDFEVLGSVLVVVDKLFDLQ